MSEINKTAVEAFLTSFQSSLCEQLTAIDYRNCNDVGEQKDFGIDRWDREQGGGGITRVLSEGYTFEKAGVNFSRVSGAALPPAATASRPELTGRNFEAMGVSIVVHPRNPFVPTSHANVRFFVAEQENEPPVWWFGGGFDLTPYYPFREDCISWHQHAKNLCDPYGEGVYAEYKEWCDRYFYLPHRQENRGIGGIFFDDLNSWGFNRSFEFMQAVARCYARAYIEIVQRRQHLAFTQAQRDFQRYRRGRYVEFNLVHDRGTLFGLQSGGRTESILMSLPPVVEWHYQFPIVDGSAEAELTSDFLKPQDWLSHNDE